MKSADPYYQFQHEKQQAGLEGLNLEASCRTEIVQISQKITWDSIEKFDDTQFHVASQTKSGSYYSINLIPPTCSCPDFLRIRFCKHIGAIYFYFPHVRPGQAPVASPAPSVPERLPAQSASTNTFHLLVQDVNALSHQLISDRNNNLALSPAAVDTVRSAKASLTTAIALVNGSSPLLIKKRIAPNQHSWTENCQGYGRQEGHQAPTPRRDWADGEGHWPHEGKAPPGVYRPVYRRRETWHVKKQPSQDVLHGDAAEEELGLACLVSSYTLLHQNSQPGRERPADSSQ